MCNKRLLRKPLTILQTDQLRHYSVQEYGTVEVELAPDVAADMHSDGHVSVAPTASAHRYLVKAKHKVGILRYGDVELRIKPKIPVSRLLYLATFGDDARSWRELEALLDVVEDPLSAVGHALAYHAEVALRPTPLQGYVTHDSAERKPRGRILFEQQSRRAGVSIPIDIRYDEFEVNIVENRVLKAAIGLVEQIITEPDLSRRLAHLRFRLDGVEPWPVGYPIPGIIFTRMNNRYRPALALAKVVLEKESLEFHQQTQRGTAFLFNMNEVFEKYLEATLRQELENLGGRVDGQRSMFLDEDDTIVMRPDITWWFEDRCRAVVDAKYKVTQFDDSPNADVYQLLAYCTRLGLQKGLLVYADLGGQLERSAVVRDSGITIISTGINISGSLDELERSVEYLVNLIRSIESSSC